jgi:hypothetical protein
MRMDISEKIKNTGCLVFGILFLVGLITTILFVVRGAFWVGEKVLPFLLDLTGFVSLIVFFVFVPMTFFKKLRRKAGKALFFSSFLFGLTAWVYSALVAYTLWDLLGLFIGLFIFGVGVVPVGIIAALISGEWIMASSIIYLIVLTLASRFFGLWTIRKTEERKEEFIDAEYREID